MRRYNSRKRAFEDVPISEEDNLNEAPPALRSRLSNRPRTVADRYRQIKAPPPPPQPQQPCASTSWAGTFPLAFLECPSMEIEDEQALRFGSTPATNQAPFGQTQQFGRSNAPTGFRSTPATNQAPFGQTQQFGRSNAPTGFGSTPATNQAPFGQTQQFGRSNAPTGFGSTPATNQAPFGQTQQFGRSNAPTGFGSTSATNQAPFGQTQQFGRSNALTGFGSTPATNQAPFGQTQQFGKSNAPTGCRSSPSLFGSTPQQAGSSLFPGSTFGATQSSGFGSGLLGQQQTTPQNALFPSRDVSTFGQQNKQPGFGFSSSALSNMFGQQPQQAQSSFQPSTSSGVFGNTPGFGTTMTQQLGTVIKFNSVMGSDTIQKSGITHSIATKHHCITLMQEYESKSLEELRWEDYQANRKGKILLGVILPATTAPSLFGQTDNKASLPTTSSGAGTSGFGLGTQGFSTPVSQQSTFGTSSFASATQKPTAAFGGNTFGQINLAPNIFTDSSNLFSHVNQNPFNTLQQPPAQTGFGQPAQQGFMGTQGFSTPVSQQSTFGTSSFASATQKPTAAFGGNTFGQINLAPNIFTDSSNLFSHVNQNPFNTLQQPPAQTGFGQPAQQGFMGTQPGNTSFFGNTNKSLFGGGQNNTFFGSSANTANAGFMLPQQQQTLQTNLVEPSSMAPDYSRTVNELYDSFSPSTEFMKNVTKFHHATDPKEIVDLINSEAPVALVPTVSNLRSVDPSDFHSEYKRYQHTLLTGIETPRGSKLKSSCRRLNIRRTKKCSPLPVLSGLSEVLLEKDKQKLSFSTPQTDNERSLIDQPPIQGDSECAHTAKKRAETVSFETSSVLSPGGNSPLDTLMDEFAAVRRETEMQGLDMTPGPSKKQDTIPDQIFSTPDLHSPGASPISILTGTKAKSKAVKCVGFSDTDNADSSSTHITSCTRNIHTLEDNSIPGTSNKETSTEADSQLAEDDSAPSPCGITLKRYGYYTVPQLEDLPRYLNENGECIVKGFTIGRTGFGNIYFLDKINVANLNLDEIVSIDFHNVTVYPDDKVKPPVGQGLNGRAQVTLDRVWPADGVRKEQLLKGHEVETNRFLERLQELAVGQSAKHLDYRLETGSWVFIVEHFSKYCYVDEDEPVVTKPTKDTVSIAVGGDELINKDLGLQKTDRFAQPLVSGSEKVSQTLGSGSLPIKKSFFKHVDDDEMIEEKIQQLHEIDVVGECETNEINDVTEMDIDINETESYMNETESYILGNNYRSFTYKPLDGRNLNDLFLFKTSFTKEPEDQASVSNDSSDELKLQNSSNAFVPIANDQFQLTGYDHNIECFVLNNYQDVPKNKTLITSRNFMHPMVFCGRSFKIGWRSGFKLICNANHINTLKICQEEIVDPNTLLATLKVDSIGDRNRQLNLEEHLKIVLEESFIVENENSDVPLFKVKEGWRSLIRHSYTAQNFDRNILKFDNSSYFADVWTLCLAFWGPDANTPTEQLELFSNWMKNTLTPYMDYELVVTRGNRDLVLKNIFTYLTVHRIQEAAQLALDENLTNLGMLITDCLTSESSRNFLYNQLLQWETNDILKELNTTLLKIYILLAGVPSMGGVNVFESLDWKRALAINLWYMIPAGTSLLNALHAYQRQFQEKNAKPPTSDYWVINSSFDLQYHIMMLFENHALELNTILNPSTHIGNALNYCMSWLMLQSLTALRKGVSLEQCASTIHLNFSSQLEDEGKWEWAVFVLLFIKDASVKKNAIMKILHRNLNVDRLDINNRDIEDFFVNSLKLSSECIHSVLANKSQFFEMPLETYKHLTCAKTWDKAHRYAMLEIVPLLILSGQMDRLLKLLQYILPGKTTLASWNKEGGLMLEFLELKQMLAARSKDMQEKELLKICARIINICDRMTNTNIKTMQQSLAITEIGRFCIELLRVMSKDANEDKDVYKKIEALQIPLDIKVQELTNYFYKHEYTSY